MATKAVLIKKLIQELYLYSLGQIPGLKIVFLADVLTVALMLQCCVCLSVCLSVCDVMYCG